MSGNVKKVAQWPWGWIGLLAGAGLGLFDFGIMWALGADMTFRERDVTVWVFAAFGLTYGALGFAVGRIILERGRARGDAATIAEQLRRLERAQAELVQQEKLAAIGRLAAGVAHEVRNPLGVIRSSASMVRESFDPGEDPHRACGFICEEIDRLDGLISSLLNFARPSEPRLETTSLPKVIDRALQLASEDLRRRNIELRREGAADGPELRADPDLLAQLIFGLVVNASEAIEARGVIAVRCGSDERAAWVEVADSGPGVDPDVSAQIFEPFCTTKASGTGLGLAMGQRIAEAHGGRLTTLVGSGAGPGGAGACFQLHLPHNADGGAGATA